MSEQNIDKGYELGWDAEIEKDGASFSLVPAGDYEFEITQFERGRHAGSDKVPACPKAIVYFKIESEGEETVIKKEFLLHSRLEGILCEFFTAIGQRQHGEKLKMNWNTVVGSKGRSKIGIRKYEGKEYNEIKKFYEPEGKPGFKAGEF